MRLLVHDYAGHPFQAQLSRELAARGHDVVHSFCAAEVSGKGHLAAEAGETLIFEPIGVGQDVEKDRLVRRLVQNLQQGIQLVRQVSRRRPDVVLAANLPVPALMMMAAFLRLRGTPWVLWHQDIQGVAVGSFAGRKLPRMFGVVGRLFAAGEAWSARRAGAVVVIAESFLEVHRAWGTADRTTVIPNWAPLDEIFPVERKNDWAVEQHVDDVATLLYAGTLGLKHQPQLLPRLARRVIDNGTPVRLVVVNEGSATDVLSREAAALDVPVSLLPYQPYERLPEVLGSGDVLVVLLDREAGEFSVPSKTMSYLCAGRPVLGLMPGENLAAGLIAEVDGCVLPPEEENLDAAAAWVSGLLTAADRRGELGQRACDFAEREFGLGGCADRFEQILVGTSRAGRLKS